MQNFSDVTQVGTYSYLFESIVRGLEAVLVSIVITFLRVNRIDEIIRIVEKMKRQRCWLLWKINSTVRQNSKQDKYEQDRTYVCTCLKYFLHIYYVSFDREVSFVYVIDD